MTIPKIAVIVTGLTTAVLVAVINPATPAQALPTYGVTCIGCHTAGGSVTATPSNATQAPGAAYTVAIAITSAGSGTSGFNISLGGTSLTTGGPDAGKTFTANMTAPTAAGSYTYNVGADTGAPPGEASGTTYTITVAPVGTTTTTTTEPPTSTTTTEPPTSTTTSEPPTSTTTSEPPTSTTTSEPPTSTTTTEPPTTLPTVRVGEGDLRPSSLVGTKHLGMYATYGGISCTVCHSGLSQPKPPVISGEDLNMGGTTACGTCHDGRREFTIFTAKMKPAAATATTPAGASIAYGRCSDCHVIARGGSDGHGDSDGDGGSDGHGDSDGHGGSDGYGGWND